MVENIILVVNGDVVSMLNVLYEVNRHISIAISILS